ncbi:hypothetical protein A2450_03420 [candidate division WWE3 bacterium RIFOXYC2_FULL_40_11]|nr:MAG: hypothetical protein A2450_03420 [candidate division WWE3 bacterium RIFOXYC2_FULL_40_11]OGC70385.1 MAG: hypothetical protein A2602_04795 [candidate division WWE3 bacterium RIFOXYD1_FULL_40_11]
MPFQCYTLPSSLIKSLGHVAIKRSNAMKKQFMLYVEYVFAQWNYLVMLMLGGVFFGVWLVTITIPNTTVKLIGIAFLLSGCISSGIAIYNPLSYFKNEKYRCKRAHLEELSHKMDWLVANMCKACKKGSLPKTQASDLILFLISYYMAGGDLEHKIEELNKSSYILLFTTNTQGTSVHIESKPGAPAMMITVCIGNDLKHLAEGEFCS